MKQTLKIIAASALATGALLKAAPAFAETATPHVRVVQTADLNLASEAGRRALEHRLVIAAHEVCGTASVVDLAGNNQARVCRKSVLAEARAKGAALAAGTAAEPTVLVAAR